MPILPLEIDDDDVAGEDNHEDDDYSDVESCYSNTSLDSPNWEPMETDESDVITSEGYQFSLTILMVVCFVQ